MCSCAPAPVFLYCLQRQPLLSSMGLLCCVPWVWHCPHAAGGWLGPWAVKKPSRCLSTEALPSRSTALPKEGRIWRVSSSALSAFLIARSRIHLGNGSLGSPTDVGIRMWTEPRLLQAQMRAHSLKAGRLMGNKFVCQLCTRPVKHPWARNWDFALSPFPLGPAQAKTHCSVGRD